MKNQIPKHTIRYDTMRFPRHSVPVQKRIRTDFPSNKCFRSRKAHLCRRQAWSLPPSASSQDRDIIRRQLRATFLSDPRSSTFDRNSTRFDDCDAPPPLRPVAICNPVGTSSSSSSSSYIIKRQNTHTTRYPSLITIAQDLRQLSRLAASCSPSNQCHSMLLHKVEYLVLEFPDAKSVRRAAANHCRSIDLRGFDFRGSHANVGGG